MAHERRALLVALHNRHLEERRRLNSKTEFRAVRTEWLESEEGIKSFNPVFDVIPTLDEMPKADTSDIMRTYHATVETNEEAA